MSRKSRVYPGCVFKNSSIGDYSFINCFSIVNQTSIGRYCSIGMFFKSGMGFHPTKFLSTSPSFYSAAAPIARPSAPSQEVAEYRPVSIGNDVWIGTSVIILDGVRVGDGAIIGAGCVVTRDVTPYSIVVGVPGRPIRNRFDDLLIQKLLALRWWEYDLDKLPPEETDYLFTGEFTLDKIDTLERRCHELGRLPEE